MKSKPDIAPVLGSRNSRYHAIKRPKNLISGKYKDDHAATFSAARKAEKDSGGIKQNTKNLDRNSQAISRNLLVSDLQIPSNTSGASQNKQSKGLEVSTTVIINKE